MAQRGGKDEKWPGFPERLRDAFRQAGRWKNGRPDLMRFALECGIHVGYLYKYVGGDAVPDRERLLILARALGVRPGWLLLGDEEGKPRQPSRGAKSTKKPLPVERPSRLKEKHTMDSVSARKHESLRKVRSNRMVRGLQRLGRLRPAGTALSVA